MHARAPGSVVAVMGPADEDEADRAAVDRDLEMLIEPQEDDGDEDEAAGGRVMVVDLPDGPDNASGGGRGRVGGRMDVSRLLAEELDDDKIGMEHGADGKARGLCYATLEGAG